MKRIFRVCALLPLLSPGWALAQAVPAVDPDYEGLLDELPAELEPLMAAPQGSVLKIIVIAGMALLQSSDQPVLSEAYIDFLRRIQEERGKYLKAHPYPSPDPNPNPCGAAETSSIITRVRKIDLKKQMIDLRDAYFRPAGKRMIPFSKLPFMPEIDQFLVLDVGFNRDERGKPVVDWNCIQIRHDTNDVVHRAIHQPRSLSEKDRELLRQLFENKQIGRYAAQSRFYGPSRGSAWLNTPTLNTPWVHPSGVPPMLHVLPDP